MKTLKVIFSKIFLNLAIILFLTRNHHTADIIDTEPTKYATSYSAQFRGGMIFFNKCSHHVTWISVLFLGKYSTKFFSTNSNTEKND